jgi:hypothetical protein
MKKNLQIGDRLVRAKGVIGHHGIFVGFHRGNYLVAENNTPKGVRYVTYDQFLNGNKLLRFEPFSGSESQRNQIIPFINSKIGTVYNLFSYNCEHFASEVLTGKPTSKQVEIGVGLGVLLLFAFAIKA